MPKISICSIFKLSLFITLLLSFYIFINTIFLSKKHVGLFNTWQFPMLLAMYLDVCHI